MSTTIPKKALVALPDSVNGSGTPGLFSIVPPEEAKVSFFDRSYHFGDSLYEVTRSYDGILFSLDEHMRRLEKSAELAMFEVKPDTDFIYTMVRETCRAYFQKFGNSDVYVRVTLSRGIGDLNIDRKTSSDPYAIVIVKELDTTKPEMYDKGMHYAVVSRFRNHPAALDPAMKSGNYLNNVLALAEAKKLGAQDALLLNYQGFVTEGSTNNVYAVKDGEVWTAPLEVGILKGITRDWVFEICKKEGIKVQERLFTETELRSCQEMFLTSATKEVMPITLLNHQPVGGTGKPGPITKRLNLALRQLITDYCNKRRSESLYV